MEDHDAAVVMLSNSLSLTVCIEEYEEYREHPNPEAEKAEDEVSRL